MKLFYNTFYENVSNDNRASKSFGNITISNTAVQSTNEYCFEIFDGQFTKLDINLSSFLSFIVNGHILSQFEFCLEIH